MNWDIISHVIIIIELADREYLPKRRLEDKFKSVGYQTIILTREYAKLYLKKNKNIAKSIVIIEKSSQYYQESWFKSVKEAGASLIIFEEEGWVPFTWKDFMLRRLPKSITKYINEYWCSNEIQFNKVSDYYPELNVVMTGHPRWHLKLKKEMLPGKIQNILLVSTFGMLSSDINFFKTIKVETGYFYDKEFYEDIFFQLNKKFDYWIKFLKMCIQQENPNLNFTLRLHPAEKLVYDYQILNEIPISKESLNDDMKKTDLIIHPGSTVAFDGEFSGTPCLLLNDSTDILLSSDPNMQKLSSKQILDFLKTSPLKEDVYKKTCMLSDFNYSFQICKIKIPQRMQIPMAQIVLYKFMIKILSFFNYKGYRRLYNKIQLLSKNEVIS